MGITGLVLLMLQLLLDFSPFFPLALSFTALDTVQEASLNQI